MSANATGGLTKATGALSVPARRLRLEKPREPSASGDAPQDFRERRGPKPTRRAAYHFDTNGVSPWNAPALSSAFAAQVIAQAMNVSDGSSAAAARCYRTPRALPALFFDRSF